MIRRGLAALLVVCAPMAARTLVYEQNVGQAGRDALFLARVNGYALHLTPDGAVFRFPSSTLRLRMERARISPVDGLAGVTNYLIGAPERWHRDVKGYAGVRYAGVSRGVDVLFSSEDGQPAWQYIFSPGASAADTVGVFEGASRLHVDTAGDLLIEVGRESLRVARPTAYQMVNGARHLAKAAYEIAGQDRVRIHSTWPDRSRPLVIDPVVSRLTYTGGSAADVIYSVAADPHGGAYLAGETRSVDIAGAIGQPPSGANTQILIIKLNAAGEVVYTVLTGGSGDDVAYGVAVDSSGRVHLAGRTSSPDFPVTRGAQQSTKGGGWDGFYLSLSADGKTVRAATYLGGAEDDKAQAIAVDRAGTVYVAGSTLSDSFPQTAGKRRGMSDGFVARLDAETAHCRYVVRVGGSGQDYVNGVALDTTGGVWIAGQTDSSDLPVTAHALQREKRGLWDAFVARLDTQNGKLQYATFLGGGPSGRSRGIDNAFGVAVDAGGSVWVAGETDSSDFPVTEGALERSNVSGRKGFVVRLDQGATKLGYGTYLSGNGESSARTVVAEKDRVVVSGAADGKILTLVMDRARGSVVCSAPPMGSAQDRPGGAVFQADGSVLIAGSTPATALGAAMKTARGHVFFTSLRCDPK